MKQFFLQQCESGVIPSEMPWRLADLPSTLLQQSLAHVPSGTPSGKYILGLGLGLDRYQSKVGLGEDS